MSILSQESNLNSIGDNKKIQKLSKMFVCVIYRLVSVWKDCYKFMPRFTCLFSITILVQIWESKIIWTQPQLFVMCQLEGNVCIVLMHSLPPTTQPCSRTSHQRVSHQHYDALPIINIFSLLACGNIYYFSIF